MNFKQFSQTTFLVSTRQDTSKYRAHTQQLAEYFTYTIITHSLHLFNGTLQYYAT